MRSQPGFRAPPDPGLSVPRLSDAESKGLHFKFADGSVVPAAHVSEGMLLVVGYLTVLHLPDPPRLVLVEEPENGIHPRRLEQVVGVFRDLVRTSDTTQVVMSSHSPYVVDLFEPAEVLVCTRDGERGVVVSPMSSSDRVRDQIRYFTLGEIWSADGENGLVAPARGATRSSAPSAACARRATAAATRSRS